MIKLIDNDSVELAKEYCMHFLDGQYRKGNNLPIHTHSFEVVNILKKYGYDDPVTQCMGYLHDTVEDSKLYMDKIQDVFGYEISNGVYILSRNKGKMADKRKLTPHEYKQRLMFARNKIKRVKIADMIHNTRDLPSLSEESIDNKIEDAAYFYIPIGFEACPIMVKELIDNIDNYLIKEGIVKI